MMASALIERELASSSAPLRSGVFVAVVGPSGAGKDTLIAHARATLGEEAGIDFVRRVITRPADKSSEDHDTLEDAAFDEAYESGAFAIAWSAHGLKYGLPASVDETVGNGRVAIANVSRGAIAALMERYANVMVVEVTAAPEILAERLARRGRESRGEVIARLERSAGRDLAIPQAIRIDNGGAREAACERFLAVLRKAVAAADVGGVV